MTDTNTIQRARDALAKWREGSTGAWRVDALTHIGDVYLDDGTMLAGDQPLDRARLIVGTAGNPDLRDAIDGLLRVAERPGASGAIRHHGAALAAAIITAEEKMSA